MRAGLLLGVLYLFFTSGLSAQVSNEADFKKKFGLVDGYLYDGDYYKALPLAKELYAYDSTNANLSYMLGTAYLGADPDRTKAVYYLEQAIILSAPSLMYKEGDYKERGTPGITYYNLAKAYHFSYRFDEAISNYYNYRSFVDLEDVKVYTEVKRQIEYSENAKLLTEQPVSIKVQSLGPVINSKYEDYSPVISADGNTLIFTSRREGSTGGKFFFDGKYYEDIYIAKKERGKWTTPRSIGTNINTDGHEATIGLSPDGQQLFIYKDDNGDGNIYQSKLNGTEWSKPEKLGGEINTTAWETHATISADLQNLFFISNRSGGIGGRDIYKVSLLPDGTYSKPENLGAIINTPYDEEAPFFAADGRTLIFSSQGFNSMGGFDIFTSENIDGVWSTPVNIGYPINSPEDDVFFVTTPDGLNAYYSSRMEGGMGEKDIYLIEFSEKKKESLTVMKGRIVIDRNSEILANIIVNDASNNTVIGIYKPNKTTGSFVFILQPGAEYNVTYECEGYQSKNDKVVVPQNSSYSEITKAVILDPVEFGDKNAIASKEEKKSEEVQLVENKSDINEKLKAELAELEAQLLAEEKTLKENEEKAAKRQQEEIQLAAKAAEDKRLAEETLIRKKAEEQAQLAEEKKKSEELKLSEAKIAEERQLAEAAAQAKAVEAARQAEEKKKLEETAKTKTQEEIRLAAEKKKLDEIKLADTKAAEEKRLEAEEAARLAAEKKKLDEIKIADTKAAEEKRLEAEEAARLAAEKKKLDEIKIADTKAAEEKSLELEASFSKKAEEANRLAAEKKKEDELKVAEAKRIGEEKRLAEEAAKEKAAEEARVAEEKRKAEEAAIAKEEAKRIAEERRLAEQAAIAKAEEAARLAEEKRKLEEAAKAKAEEEARVVAEKKKQEDEQKALVEKRKKIFEDSLVARKNEIIKRLEDLKKLQAQKLAKEKQDMASGFAKESIDEQKKQEEMRLAEEKRKAEAKQAAEKKLAEEKLANDEANRTKLEEIRIAAQKEAEEKKIEDEKKAAEAKLASEKYAAEESARKALIEKERKAQEAALEEKRLAEVAAEKAKAEEDAKNQAYALANSKSIEELKKMNQILIAENEQLKKQIAESSSQINQLTQQVTDQNKKYEELLAKFEEIQKQQKLQSAVKTTDFESFKKGGSVVLKNILFDYNLSIIRKESEDELQKLFTFMKDNKDVKIEVSGHTDSHGNDDYNIALSRDRANAVVRYLTRKGIDANRFKTVGMGEGQPIAINESPDGSDNPEGRQLNRRIEIRILNMGVNNVEIEEFNVPTELKPKS